jgi:hypothetical protein
MAFRSRIHKRIRIVNHKRIDIRIRIQHAIITTPRCKTKRTTPRLFAPQATNNHLGI